MYYYYGSETQPPCKENVLWQVFSETRALSKNQFKFMYHQLVKKMDGSMVDSSVVSYLDVYGNKRNAQFYNPNKRTSIHYNPTGSHGSSRKSS